MNTPNPNPSPELRYRRALRECAESSLENNDAAGADAITAMAEWPAAEHAAYARSRRGYPRAACINAIEYARQECAA